MYPVMSGGEPSQRPKVPAARTDTALHVEVGSSTASPLMTVKGISGVLVTPAVATIANGAANPRFTGPNAALTVKIAGSAISAPILAVMVDVPMKRPRARPCDPIEAMRGVPVPQVASSVLSLVVPSLNVSIA
jgi:hypothetical protein